MTGLTALNKKYSFFAWAERNWWQAYIL